MQPHLLLEQLRLIFADPRAAVGEFRAEPVLPATRVLLRKHLLLLATVPLFSLAAPLRWILGSSLSPARDLVAPLVLIGGFLALAMVFDKTLERSRGPELPRADAPPVNIALFLHLPVSATGVFFLFHFSAGYLMILVSGLYCAWISMLNAGRHHGLTPARVLTTYLSAILFLLLPLVALLLLLNLLRTYSIFRYLYF